MRKLMIFITVLALLLGLALDGCRVAGKDPDPIVPEDTDEREWDPEFPDVDADSWGLEDVCLLSASNGWAVGWKIPDLEGDSPLPRPLVLRRQGGRWREETLGASGSTLATLYGVGVAPNGDLWCVGGSEGNPVVLYKRGGQWRRLAQPAGQDWPDGWPDVLRAVTFKDGQTVYLSGEGGPDGVLRLEEGPTGTFSATLYPLGGPGRSMVWADKGYAVGSDGDDGRVWQSTDQFRQQAAGVPAFSGQLTDLDLFSDGSGWAAGYDSSGPNVQPLLLEHSGAAWTRTLFPRALDSYLSAVSLASSREGWAVGHEIRPSQKQHGILLRYREKGGWTEPFAGLEKFDAYSWRLNGVSALSTRDACAVGTVTLNGGRCKGVAFSYTLNKAPLLEPIGDKLATGGEELSFTIHATDPDGGPVTYAAFNLPPGASFDADSATFTWVAPQLGYAGIEATFVATDADGLSDLEVVNIGAEAQLTLTLCVASNPLWTDTGLTLVAGHQVRIVAVGTDRWSWGGVATHAAAGFLPWNKPNTYDRFLFEANHGEMIGYVGADPYQGNWGHYYYDWYGEGDSRSGRNQWPGYLHVGESAVTTNGFHWTADRSGRLWLGFNDDTQSKAISDNEGSVEVTIHVSGRPAE